MKVTSSSLRLVEGLLEVFQSWELTEIKTQNGNAIYRIWVRFKLELQKLSEIIYNSVDLYLIGDDSKIPLWKIVDGKIVRTSISTRISFRTNIEY